MKRKDWLLLLILILFFPFLIAAGKKPLALYGGVPGQIRTGDTVVDGDSNPVGGGTTVNSINLTPPGVGSFELWPDGTTSPPFGTAAEVTPTIARDTGMVGLGSYSVKITGAGAANEGINITYSTLKASTAYRIGVMAKATSGDTATLITTGCASNLSQTVTATTFTWMGGTCTTDATPTNIVIKLVAAADTDIVWFDGLMVNEGTTSYAYAPGLMTGENRLQFRAFLGSNQAITANTWTRINMGSETFDPFNKYDEVTNYRYTPGEDGYYLCGAKATVLSLADQQLTNFAIYVNNIEYSSSPFYAGAGGNFGLKVEDYILLDQDDYVEVFVYVATTGRSVQGLSIDTSFWCTKTN